MKKVILFTHDDLDGAGCRVIFEVYANTAQLKEWQVVICSNNNVDQKVNDTISEAVVSHTTTLIFADICCSKDLLTWLNNKFDNVIVYDHHLTNMYAKDVIGDKAHIISVNDKGKMESGTSILYKFSIRECFSEVNDLDIYDCDTEMMLMDEFVDTVRSYDTYEWKSTGNKNAKALQTLFGLLGMNNFCNTFITRIKNACDFSNLISDDEYRFINAKLDNEQAIIDKFTEDDIIPVKVKGYNTALCLKSVFANISELAYQFLTKYPKYDIFVCASLKEGGVFEIRTIRDDIDTGKKIAAPIGGGGHPKASGAPIKKAVINAFKDILLAQLNERLEVDE